MPLFTYNRDIPDGPNNPSVDQPKMKVNTNSTDDLIAVDHYSFGVSNGGLHRQSTYPVEAAPTTGASQGAVYTKTNGSTVDLYYRTQNNGIEIQLTNSSVGGVGLVNCAASFNAFGVANGVLAAGDIGYSFNIASITKVGTGNYTIVFTNNLPSANYVVVFSFVDDSGSAQKDLHVGKVITSTRTISSFDMETRRSGNQSSDDPIQIMLTCIGG